MAITARNTNSSVQITVSDHKGSVATITVSTRNAHIAQYEVQQLCSVSRRVNSPVFIHMLNTIQTVYNQ